MPKAEILAFGRENAPSHPRALAKDLDPKGIPKADG
ncbi:hypothetical protein DES36_101145 [Alkalibaculum bacchi]|uniref:Uncharacterized protein n=1 Tax=Alkalibaculum bacchi TaxID=645887 RepID=A0A366IFF5_9FIRM|nr:hypothetical protein DES36_101145 [Alkalibaculum bacchi]